MTRFQWGIYRANLNPIRGSEQGGTRPVLVVSGEAINLALPIVGICPLTSLKPGRRIYSTEVLIPAGEGGLSLDSLVMTHQIRTLAKERLANRLGSLESDALKEAVKVALGIFLDLE